MKFCNKHRLPENHNCPFDLIGIRYAKNNSFKKDIIYQDALDFMSNGLTVAKIYDYVTSKKLQKSEAIDLLNYFLENSEDTEVRRNSIIAFKLLSLKNTKVYKILEDCLLSDDNPIIKQTAMNILSQMFPKESSDLIKWIREHSKDLD